MPTYYVSSSSSHSPLHTRSRSYSSDGRHRYAQPMKYTTSHRSTSRSHNRYPSSSSSNNGYRDTGHHARRHSNAGNNEAYYSYPHSYGNASHSSNGAYGSHGSGGRVYHIQAPSSSHRHSPPQVQVIDMRHHRSSRAPSVQRDSGHHHKHRRYSEPSLGERLKHFFGFGDHHRSTSTTRDPGRTSRSRSRRSSEYRDSRGRHVDEYGRAIYQV